MPDSHTIHVVIFKDGDCFVASAVEVDIAAQGKTPDDAFRSLGVVLRAEIAERGGNLAEIGPAPDVIRNLYEGRDDRLVSREKLAA